jgi:hypothetical protein
MQLRKDASRSAAARASVWSVIAPNPGWLSTSGAGPGAIDEYHRAIDLGYRVFPPYVDLAAACALKGSMEQVKARVGR